MPNQSNFKIFYYFYDAMAVDGKLKHYHLEDKNYKYLKRVAALNNPKSNAKNYAEVLRLLEVLEFEPEQIEIVQNILAAIILIGEIGFDEGSENGSQVNNSELVNKGWSFLKFRNCRVFAESKMECKKSK